MFTTYVLFSRKYNQIYIGYTTDLIDRFHSHNSLATKGHTIKYRPWELIHVEFFDDRKHAMKREKELKSFQGRTFIRKTYTI